MYHVICFAGIHFQLVSLVHMVGCMWKFCSLTYLVKILKVWIIRKPAKRKKHVQVIYNCTTVYKT